MGSSVGPSLATVGSTLYAVWKGEGSDESLWYASYNGMKWSGQTQIPDVGSSIGAAAAEFDSKLYAMWKGEGSDVSLYNAHLNGTKWSAQTNDIPGNTGPDTGTTPLATPAGSSSNYAFSDSKAAHIIGASVTIYVAEDIVPDSGGDYSFQINCFGPSQTGNAPAFLWQQYIFVVTDGEICARINCFRAQDFATEDPFLNWDSRPPRMPQGQGTVPVPNNVLPQGTQLTMTLVTNGSGAVVGFSFNIAVPGQTPVNTPVVKLQNISSATASDNLAPIINFQAILVAKLGGNAQDFSAGKGVFLFDEENDLVASAATVESGETSNIQYGALAASYANGEFYQYFGVSPV